MRETHRIILLFTQASVQQTSITESSLHVAVPGLKEAFKTTSVHNVSEVQIQSKSSTGGSFRAMHIRLNAGIVQTQWTVVEIL